MGLLGNGTKKRGPVRTHALRPAPSMLGRLEGKVRDRKLLLRLLICLAGAIGLVLAVEGWKEPFPYRLGSFAENGVVARTDFHRIDRQRTIRAQDARAEQVPYHFRHNPEPLLLLPSLLRNSLREIAEADTLDEVSPEVRAEFGLALNPADAAAEPMTAGKVDQEFATLRSAVSLRGESSGSQIDNLVADFKHFIDPLTRYGIADSDELTRAEIRADRPVAIVNTGDPGSEPVVGSVSDIRLNQLIQDTGRLGKSWGSYPELRAMRPQLERWLTQRAPVTLSYDSTATQDARRKAREQVEPITEDFDAGDLLVPPGQPIDESALEVLRAEYDAVEDATRPIDRVMRVTAVFALILVLMGVSGYYLVRSEPRLQRSARRLGLYLIAVIIAVLVSRFVSFDPWRAEVLPLLATVMVLAIAYNQEVAGLTALVLTLVITASTSRELSQLVVLTSVTLLAVMPLTHVPSRSTIIKVGFLAAGAYFFISWSSGILAAQRISAVWTDLNLLRESLVGAGWCLAAGYLVAGSLPFIESSFGVVTDISLLEMSDISHPLLQELVRRAPGTYNHSITVASIGEAAAEQIGANGLLVRVGAYFHDVGKMLKPSYFVENTAEGSKSRHESLAPAMSTLIIIGHVKDGVDLARQQNLPQPLIDFIEQHHGTTLVEYFYHAAARQADSDHKTDAEESSFRYPGPKPQTKETAVLMLADAVESTSRTLSEPTARRIETLVHDITMKRLLDGQFDESSLTMSELRAVEDSLTKSLIAIHHGRIKYPDQKSA